MNVYIFTVRKIGTSTLGKVEDPVFTLREKDLTFTLFTYAIYIKKKIKSLFGSTQ